MEGGALFLPLYHLGKHWIGPGGGQIPAEPQLPHPTSQTPSLQDLSFLSHLTTEQNRICIIIIVIIMYNDKTYTMLI